jgi:hypothetical protein
MQKHVILLSGPGGSGKDATSDYLVGQYGFEHIKFSQPLRDAACAIFSIEEDEIEEFKRRKLTNGKTGRDWMIGLAETVTKPILGPEWFGVQSANQIIKLENKTRFVVSDAGFDEEVKAFTKALRQSNTGHYIFWMWHLERPGCSFDGDSRNYVYTKFCKPELIHNTGDLDDLHHEIDELMVL